MQSTAKAEQGPFNFGFMAVWTRLSTYGVLAFLASFPTSLLVASSRIRRELAVPTRASLCPPRGDDREAAACAARAARP
jgi:hypothetical protein